MSDWMENAFVGEAAEPFTRSAEIESALRDEIHRANWFAFTLNAGLKHLFLIRKSWRS